MNTRRGYSDTKLTQKLKPVFDEENLDNFLPKSLLKDINPKEEGRRMKENLDQIDGERRKTIFEPHEEEDLADYLRHLTFKENLENIPQNQGPIKMKVPRSKFHSNADLRQFAKEHKNQLYNQFQSQLQAHPSSNYNPYNYNINYNISQNINQNISGGKPGSPWENKLSEPKYSHREPRIDRQHSNFANPHVNKIYSASPNDSGNFSMGEELINFLVPPKRNNSSTTLDSAKRQSALKGKSSLFLCADKEEKGEDFADLQELLDSITVDLWDYAKTQKGSRNLQKLLNKIQPEGLDSILEKLKNNFPELMIDTYGNYFCQKLIQSCSAEQRMFILRHIMNEFTDIGCNPSGTHALQSLIEIVNMPGEEELVKEAVSDNILTLSYDVNGTHVIQKVISCISEENREFINSTVLNNMHKLVYDSNGICVLKKFINANKNPALRKFLLDEITKNALEIVQNPFGNYVIQHILDEWGPEVAQDIINVIISTMISLSMQKFSSNVVEKCFDLVDMPTRKRMVKELFNAAKISSLLKNKYGNFVLQKAILVMTREEKKEIKEYLAKRVSFTSNKEKARLLSLIEII